MLAVQDLEFLLSFEPLILISTPPPLGSNPDGNTIVAYDANDDPITGGNLLGMSPNLLMMSNKKSKLNVTMIGPDEEEER